jgi:hypothetical protein
LIVACLTLGVCLMGETITRILFQRGAFTSNSVRLCETPAASSPALVLFWRQPGSRLASAEWAESLRIVTNSVTATVIMTCTLWLFWLRKTHSSHCLSCETSRLQYFACCWFQHSRLNDGHWHRHPFRAARLSAAWLAVFPDRRVCS